MPAELSDIAFQRYEALYEKELYTTKAYAMFGHEHQQYARRKVYEAIIAECSTPSEIVSRDSVIEEIAGETKMCEQCNRWRLTDVQIRSLKNAAPQENANGAGIGSQPSNQPSAEGPGTHPRPAEAAPQSAISSPNEHPETAQCGFDRNASHSENTYVCNCGWRDEGMTEAQKAAYWFDLYLEETTKRRALESNRSSTTLPDPSESGWTVEQALRFYSEGRHFDVVEGRTRILDTGAVASDALKGMSQEYAAAKGCNSSTVERGERERLKEIEHLAWHLLEDSEHRQDNGEVVVLKENFDALSKLLPEEHP